MRKPILTLTNKHFLTGLSGVDYSGRGGIFKNAFGVSAIRSIGNFNTTASLGLLQAGPTGSAGGSNVIVDTPLAGTRNNTDSSNSHLYVIGSSGHFYKKDMTNGAPTDLRSGTPITNPVAGIEVFQPAGGTKYLYYWQKTQIGRWDLSGTYATGWTDNQYTGLENVNMHPTHAFGSSIFYGNDYKIGRIQDDGAAGVTHSLNVLDLPQRFQVTALEDDGQFLVIAATAEKSSISSSSIGSTIKFWDRTSDFWQKEFNVADTIVSMKRIGNIIYGLGGRGIYTISFAGGIQKVWQRGTGVANSGSGRLIGPAMLSSFNDALVVAGDIGEVAIFGKPDPLLPAGYHTPIMIDAGSAYQVSFVDAEFQSGNFIIGDSSTAMKIYPIGYDGTNDTAVSAETVYIPLDRPYEIDRIDIVLGRVLASGDSLTVQVMQDDGSNYVTYGSNAEAMTFTTYGAKRRIQLKTTASVPVEDLKLKLTFNAGTVAIRKIEVYGKEQSPETR